MVNAAGTLMLIDAIFGFAVITTVYPGLPVFLPGVWLIFIILGAYYTIKRKSLKLSLTVSILVLPIGTVIPVLAWAESTIEDITPFAVGITVFQFLIGVLPFVFISLRKREWLLIKKAKE